MSIESIKAEIARLNELSVAHDKSHNDGGFGYNPHSDKIEDECRRLREAEIADYCARWPEIKTAWNAAVKKHSGPNGVRARDIPKIEAEAGISLSYVRTVKFIVEGERS